MKQIMIAGLLAFLFLSGATLAHEPGEEKASPSMRRMTQGMMRGEQGDRGSMDGMGRMEGMARMMKMMDQCMGMMGSTHSPEESKESGKK
jgi:hypothetical protein